MIGLDRSIGNAHVRRQSTYYCNIVSFGEIKYAHVRI